MSRPGTTGRAGAAKLDSAAPKDTRQKDKAANEVLAESIGGGVLERSLQGSRDAGPHWRTLIGLRRGFRKIGSVRWC